MAKRDWGELRGEHRASVRVEEARQRRVAGEAARQVRIDWFIREVSDKISMVLKSRIGLACELLKSQVVRNISTAVVKATSLRTRRIVVVERSKPGEYPRADTTQLMKTIFSDRREVSPGVWEGYVGTTLNYGLILETKMDRSFLVRTLNEQAHRVRAILTGPIKA